MTRFAFLSPTVGDALARSPVERLARAAGATFELRDGWNVAASFGGAAAERAHLTNAVGFADRSRIRKLELRHRDAGNQPRAPLVGTAARTGSGAWRCPITPERTLLLGDPELVPMDALDLTCAYAAIELAGPLAGECLARFCAIDVRPSVLPVGGFRPGSVARTPGYLLRTGPASLLLLSGWAYGEYLWETIATAAQRLGGGPVGEDALADA